VLKYARSPALWLAIGLVLGSGALSFAATSNGHGQGPKPKPSVSASADADETESPEPEETKSPEQENANRPHNHGFFVSQAAHCEDVSDPDNNVDLKAPDDCATNGKAHGGYVSSVAKSDAGKTKHNHGNDSGS
jgi:hypothetical protein